MSSLHIFRCFVQAQYVFIHNALDELHNCGETEISAENMRIAIGRLARRVHGSGVTGFEKQYEVIVISIGVFLFIFFFHLYI